MIAWYGKWCIYLKKDSIRLLKKMCDGSWGDMFLPIYSYATKAGSIFRYEDFEKFCASSKNAHCLEFLLLISNLDKIKTIFLKLLPETPKCSALGSG